MRDKAPAEKAKEFVGEIFEAISPVRDITWRELVVFGGWETQTSLPSGTLYARVRVDGCYSVEVHRRNGGVIATLAAGSYEMTEMAEGRHETPDTPERATKEPFYSGSRD